MSVPVIELALHDRVCEACGTSSTLAVCDWSHTAVTRTQRWLFHNTITICETCGFCYLSPCYSSADLTRYYADSFARFAGQVLDFSPEKRLAFIDEVLEKQKYTAIDGVIELGGNADTSFQQGLRKRFGSVAAYEPNAECCSDFNDVRQVPAGAFDLLVHYFILEHISEVRAFLRQCHRMLRCGGVMIIEVPDLTIYSRDIAALILHEHCNHFTVENLRQLAALEGFKMIDSSLELCSRSFGFVAAFERLPDGIVDSYEARVFIRNLEAINSGVQRVQSFRDRVATTIAGLRAHPEQRVVLWGANDNLLKALPNGESLDNAVLVDSDPRKANYLVSMTAVLPAEAVESIRQADHLILFTRLHAPSILNWIELHTGRRFDDAVILDY